MLLERERERERETERETETEKERVIPKLRKKKINNRGKRKSFSENVHFHHMYSIGNGNL